MKSKLKRINTAEDKITINTIQLINTNDPTEINSFQMDMYTPEKKIEKVRSEVDSVMTTVKIRVQDTILNAIRSLVIPKDRIAIRPANISFVRDADSVVPEKDQSGLFRKCRWRSDDNLKSNYFKH